MKMLPNGFTLDSDESPDDSERDFIEVDAAIPTLSCERLLSTSDRPTPLVAVGEVTPWVGGGVFFTFFGGSGMSVGPVAEVKAEPLAGLGVTRGTGTPSPPSSEWIFRSWEDSSFCTKKGKFSTSFSPFKVTSRLTPRPTGPWSTLNHTPTLTHTPLSPAGMTLAH